MSYKLKFLPSALKEWEKLDYSIRLKFKKKIKECLENPHVPANKLRGFNNHYKIKLKSSGFRLVYEVIDSDICIIVIAIGKRERNKVYKKAQKRKH